MDDHPIDCADPVIPLGYKPYLACGAGPTHKKVGKKTLFSPNGGG